MIAKIGVFVLFVWLNVIACANAKEKLVVFHAGSLAVPFKEISSEYKKLHPELEIQVEVAGSRACARKISELSKTCDVFISADYTVIDDLLVPKFSSWNIKFASNAIVIAFNKKSRKSDSINKDNWPDILLEKSIYFGRADENDDPCGYRSLLVMKLAEQYYKKVGFYNLMFKKDRRFIRHKSAELLALLDTGSIDYAFLYRSVAVQHKLSFIELPVDINLEKVTKQNVYEQVKVEVSGKKPGSHIFKTGNSIIYGLTIPKSSQNRTRAVDLIRFILAKKSGAFILNKHGQKSIVPVTKDINLLPRELRTLVKDE